MSLIFFVQNAAYAADIIRVGDLVLSNAWGRTSTSIKRPSAVYLQIRNTSSISDRLIMVHTPIAKRGELHSHLIENGVIKMRHLKHINIPATKVTSLKPGGLHVMLFGLNSLLKKGDKFPISLTFENAGQATVLVHIEDVGSMKLNKNKTRHAH